MGTCEGAYPDTWYIDCMSPPAGGVITTGIIALYAVASCGGIVFVPWFADCFLLARRMNRKRPRPIRAMRTIPTLTPIPAPAPALRPLCDLPVGTGVVEFDGPGPPDELNEALAADTAATNPVGYAPEGRFDSSAAAQRTWTAYFVRVVLVRYDVDDVVEYSPALES